MQIDRPITIALIILIIFLLVFFLLAPEYNTFLSLQKQISEKQAEYRAQFAYYDSIAEVYAALGSHKSDIQKIDDALPQAPSLAKTAYLLQQDAQANGLVVKDLSLSKSAPSGTGSGSSNSIKNIGLSMDLLGDYSSLESFVISLEKSSRLFEITSISFGSSTGTTYTFSLQIETHSY